MAERTVEDRLREEYFELLPEICRVAEQLEAEIRYRLLPISRGLDRYERLAVKSRVKECESAIESLRLRQEGQLSTAINPISIHFTACAIWRAFGSLHFPETA